MVSRESNVSAGSRPSGIDPRITRIAVVAIAVVFIALASVAVRHAREQPPAPPPPLRFTFGLPAGVSAGAGDEALDAALSPDGSEVVFVATDRGEQGGGAVQPGVAHLWRRALADERAEPLAGTAGARQPAWKPTGNVIAFFADGQLKQLTLQDGRVHVLADAPSALGASWLRDGSLLYATGAGGIRRLAASGVTEATTLADGDAAHVFPVATGNEGEFVYVAVRADGRRTVRRVSPGTERDLTATSGHAVVAAGHLLHVRDGVLLAYAFDENGALSPRGTPLALDVGVSVSGRALFAASPRVLLHAPGGTRAMEIRWVDFRGQPGLTIADVGDYSQVRLAPDDRYAAIAMTEPLLRAVDVAIVPTDGGLSPQRLTVALAAETDPVWSPDGRRVLFRSLEGGTANLFARRVPAREEPNESILRGDLDPTPTDWQGGRVLFQARRDGRFDIMTLDVSSSRVEPLVEGAFNETEGRWSPDGRWLAYVSDESGRPDVYVRRPDATRLRVSLGGGRRPRWTRDGKAVLFLRGTQVMRAGLTAGTPPGTLFAAAQPLFELPGVRDFDVAHGSDRLLALVPAEGAGPVPAIGAVLEWTALVR